MTESSQQSRALGGVASRDLSEDGRWMTYGELAAARGIDRQSAVKLVRRQRWRRQEGNNGVARVFVPSDQLTRPKSRDDARAETPDEARGAAQDNAPDPADIARYIATFEATLTVLREAHAGEIAALQNLHEANASEIAALRGERDAAQTMVDRALAMLADATARADGLQGDLDMARTQAKAAQDAIEELRRADEARKGRGLLARLRAAVRRE